MAATLATESDDGRMAYDDNWEGLVMPDDKLRALVKLMHRQEALRIWTIPFRSAHQRIQYLRDSRQAYDAALAVLDMGVKVKVKRQHLDREELDSTTFIGVGKQWDELYNLCDVSKNQASSSGVAITPELWHKQKGHRFVEVDLLSPVTNSIAHNFHMYTKFTVSMAIRTLWNLNLRDNYLKKLRAFVAEKKVTLDSITSKTSVLSPEAKLTSAREMLQELADHKQVSLEFLRSRQPPSSSAFGRLLTKWHQHSRSMFYDKVYKFQAKRAKLDPSFRGRFEDLGSREDPLFKARFEHMEISEGAETDPSFGGRFDNLGNIPKEAEFMEMEEIGAAGMLKKAEVYADIAGMTGRGTHNTLARCCKGAGAALLLFQVGMIAWDTSTSDHPLQTFEKDSVNLIGCIGAGLAVEYMVATALTAAGIVATTTLGMGAVVILIAAAGAAAAWAFGKYVGPYIDEFFGSGGKTPPKPVRHPATEHLLLHVTAMPNGETLARQLTAASAA